MDRQSKVSCVRVPMLVCGIVIMSVSSEGIAGGELEPSYAATPMLHGAKDPLIGRAILDAKLVIDDVVWKGDVAQIKMTIISSDVEIDDAVLIEITEETAAAIDPGLNFGGVELLARFDEGDSYEPIESFAARIEPGVYEDAALLGEPRPASNGAAPLALAGPVSNAGRQPSGALSGVVVYAAAGHGWTAGASSWFLQRGITNEMIEDYGNIDQLNYFVQYCFNAGATVVPFRPVGYQTNEVVLDQDDPEVTYTGSWSNSTSATHYENGRTVSGVSYRFANSSATESAVARFTPNIPESGFYPIYTWVLDSSNRTTQTYRITHSGGSLEVVVDHRMVGKGWVYLGEYYFDAGTAGHVEISNVSAISGVVIADAIRFGNGIGDVVGSGPGTVSGFPRNEEAHRYWAESETSINANGLPTSIFDCCAADDSDNVGTAARWAREMNNTSFNNDRWRRVFLEFHSNAATGTARGTLALITGNATTNQALFADIMGGEIQTDMQILDADFEHTWASRSNTFTGSFGAISTSNNSNEFDATILEVLFHDNAQDAQLMLDVKVRDAVARSSVHGLIKFLNALPSSTIPLDFPPARPEQLAVTHDGVGGVDVSWIAPPNGEAFGDAPTGYRVYTSPNGFSFDNGTDVGNVLSTTLSGIAANTTTLVRVSAVNAGGESMPTETLAIRRESSGASDFLIVSGFDRVGRSQNPRQTIAGLGTQRRPILRNVNSFDYAVQQAEALAAAGATFDSASNESVIASDVTLGDYSSLTWILGEESTADSTFNATEQSLVSSYLSAGGNIFVSGAEIAWDLDNLNNGRTFYNNSLAADYVADDANTYDVTAQAGSIFDGVTAFSFDDGAIFYDTEFPDVIAPLGGATSAMSYSGGSGGTAAIVLDGSSKVVNLGFPFETITSSAARSAIMDRVVSFFIDQCSVPADCDDSDPCTIDDCVSGVCANDPVDCDDADPCTNDSCDSQTGMCANDPINCDDGQFCNGMETCVGGSCQSGTAVNCDDGVTCTNDSCNEASDSCDNVADDGACDDGFFCNGAETCDPVQDCEAGTDPCTGGTCDEINDECVSSTELWITFKTNTSVPGVGTVADDDIVAFDPDTGDWSFVFDGSDVGISGLEINGLAVLSDGDILLSFTAAGVVSGLVGGPNGTSVDDSDIVRFTPNTLGSTTTGTFTFYFDGSDVGLSSSGEDVDAIAIADDGRLILSTIGSVSANGVSSRRDEDLLIFTDTSLGAATSGSFAQHFDGSDVGLSSSSSEDVDAASVTLAGDLLLSTVGSFSVSGAAGNDEDVIEFVPTSLGTATSGSFSIFADLSAEGISTGEDIGSMELIE